MKDNNYTAWRAAKLRTELTEEEYLVLTDYFSIGAKRNDKIINRLRRRQAIIKRLKDVYTYREIAKVMGRSAQMVFNILHEKI